MADANNKTRVPFIAGHFPGTLFILFSLAKVLLLYTSTRVCAVLRLLSI